MLIIEHSVETKAEAKAVWNLYENPRTWPQWDHEIEYADLEGPFKAGTKGRLKPKGGPEVSFVITYVDPLKVFSDTSFLPLAKLIFTHTIKQYNAKTIIITHRVEMKGLLKHLFAFIIGRKIKVGLPQAMRSLADMAEGVKD